MAQLKINIDGTKYTIEDDDQEAAALLRLADRDPDVYDLFLIDGHGVEERVRDGQIVNLKDGMRFRARRKIRFSIDGQDYSTYDDDQSASALLRLAGVDPAGYDLARVTGAGGVLTFRDEEVVTLADGDEFVTAKHVGGVA